MGQRARDLRHLAHPRPLHQPRLRRSGLAALALVRTGGLSMRFIRSATFVAVALCALFPAGGQAAAPAKPEPFGLLIMAHGGSPDWNKAVLAAVEPLKDRYPVEVAFGMADACSLQEGVRTLETKGVRKVGVVRLFVSGES